MIKSRSMKGTAVLLSLGIFACYLAFSPNSITGRGYVPDDMESGLNILAMFNAWVKGRPVPPMMWTRHGPIPVFLDLVFIKLGKLVVSPDFMMSVSPIFFTTALLTVLYLWLRKLASPGVSLMLTLTGAFGTMLWPYAYIGMETKQSFFLLLSGYLGLANGKIRSWPKFIFFSLAAGLALTSKSTGIVFAPMVAYLIWAQCRGEWRLRIKWGCTAAAVSLSLWAVSEVTRRLYWNAASGGYAVLQAWMIESPLQLFINIIGMFGSPTKGLFIYAPALILCLYAVPRAWRTQRDVTIFVILATAAMIALISLLKVSADETPASRYLHVMVAPLLLCIGAAWPRFHWRPHSILMGLAAIGFVISFLSAFSYYGLHIFAMYDSGLSTMEWNFGDPLWNEVTFNAREFRLWLKNCPSTPWTPSYVWVVGRPDGAAPWKSIDLKTYCEPQASLLRDWKNPLTGTALALYRMCALSLVIGVLSLLGVIWRTVRETWNPDALRSAWTTRHEPASTPSSK